MRQRNCCVATLLLCEIHIGASSIPPDLVGILEHGRDEAPVHGHCHRHVHALIEEEAPAVGAGRVDDRVLREGHASCLGQEGSHGHALGLELEEGRRGGDQEGGGKGGRAREGGVRRFITPMDYTQVA